MVKKEMSIIESIWKDGMISYEDRLLSLAEKENCSTIIDLGCGDGLFTKRIALKLGAIRICGIENDEKKADEARKNGVEISVSNLNECLPFSDNYFDIVFSSFVIEHLHDVDNFIREIMRILKVGGCAIVGTENLASFHNFIALAAGMQPFPMTIALSSQFRIGNIFQKNNRKRINKGESPHVRVFAYQGLKDLFEMYSYKVECVIGAGYPPFVGFLGRLMSKFDPRHSAFNLIKGRRAYC